jgi:hypothetical protein
MVLATKPTKAQFPPFYHDDDYAFNDSTYGVDAAHRKGFKRIDINVLPGGGRLNGCHWPNPLQHGWVDPLGKIPRTKLIGDMTLAEIKRLRYPKDKRLRIQSLGTILNRCAQKGLTAEVEKKGSILWRDPKWDNRLRTAQRRTKAISLVKMGSTFKTHREGLAGAHRVGLTTVILVWGTGVISRECWAYTDHYRGSGVKWVGKVPVAQ